MTVRLVYIYMVTSLVPVFKTLSSELIPDADVFNIADESLLQNTIRLNQLTSTTIGRLVCYLESAEAAGADLAMVTCSSVGSAVDIGRSLVNIPSFRVDDPMAELSVQFGHKIGVAATLQTTLNPTAALILAKAAKAGKSIEVISKLCAGAFEAVVSGDTARHDAIVLEGLKELVSEADVVVLAQASMARVAENLPEDYRWVPILSSPRLAVEHLQRVIQSL